MRAVVRLAPTDHKVSQKIAIIAKAAQHAVDRRTCIGSQVFEIHVLKYAKLGRQWIVLHKRDIASVRDIVAVDAISCVLVALFDLVENLLCHSFLIGKQGKILDPFRQLKPNPNCDQFPTCNILHTLLITYC